MNVFHCDHCGQLLFFENTTCVGCGQVLAYLPDLGVVGSLDPKGDGTYTSPIPRAQGRRYRLCQNYIQHDVCNWAVPQNDSSPLCRSCRLTRVIPDLGPPGNKLAWYKLEVAKRRLVYTLGGLKLPVASREEDPQVGLAFEFKSDPTDPRAPPVLTGHSSGVITLNIAEADDAERERRRLAMNEPYRTLLGHFRHESGHYYWDHLVAHGPRLTPFRELFGDERPNYADALKAHHRNGPPADWADRFVSSYASSHPWEDWAESWAHYLHMTDTLEMAVATGLSLKPSRPDEPTLLQLLDPPTGNKPASFERLLAAWHPLTYLLNNMNRGLGLPDGYPFVLSAPAVAKLRFVHDTIAAQLTPGQ